MLSPAVRPYNAALAVLSTAVRSLVLNTLFITLKSETWLIYNVDLLGFCLERRFLASVLVIFCNMVDLLNQTYIMVSKYSIHDWT